jgi:hypothetical protein
MDAGGPRCPSCAAPVSASQNFCPNCGASLAPSARSLPSSVSQAPPGESWDWVAVADERTARPKAVDRTQTGLMLMIIAFALLWIPYIADLGALIALIGVAFLWFGRNGFGPQHRRNVMLGSAFVVLGLLIGIVAAIWFVDSILTAVPPGGSVSALSGVFQSDLTVLFVVGFVTTGITALAYALLPFALADGTSRYLLFAGAVLTIVISAVTITVLLPQITTAVGQATSGPVINTAPVTALQGQEALFGAAQFFPNMLFLWAYYRTRSRAGSGPPPKGVPSENPGPFGRTR